MIFTEITEKNLEVYFNLAQAYEAEFSKLTGKLPNEMGIFNPDTIPTGSYSGYLIYQNRIPVGFCVVEATKWLNDVCEFYIIPVMRKKSLGYALAEHVFKKLPGQWQVRQIEGADSAIAFWRKVIGKMTNNNFKQDVVHDPNWGVVTRQSFLIPQEDTRTS